MGTHKVIHTCAPVYFKLWQIYRDNMKDIKKPVTNGIHAEKWNHAFVTLGK